MARRKKREFTAETETETKDVDVDVDGDVSLHKKGDDACEDEKTTSIDGFCSSENGGGKGKEVVLLTGGSQKAGNEVHRRNKMRDYFSQLHSFLPHLSPKTGRAELAEEAAKYIKFLEHKCQALEKRKWDHTSTYQNPSPSASSSDVNPEYCTSREAFFSDQISEIPVPTGAVGPAQAQFFTMRTSASPNVVLSVAGNDAHVSVCAPKTPGLISAMVYFLEKHGAEVLSVQVCSDTSRTMFLMHAHVSEFDDSVPPEVIFKSAEEELIIWLGPSE